MTYIVIHASFTKLFNFLITKWIFLHRRIILESVVKVELAFEQSKVSFFLTDEDKKYLLLSSSICLLSWRKGCCQQCCQVHLQRSPWSDQSPWCRCSSAAQHHGQIVRDVHPDRLCQIWKINEITQENYFFFLLSFLLSWFFFFLDFIGLLISFKNKEKK